MRRRNLRFLPLGIALMLSGAAAMWPRAQAEEPAEIHPDPPGRKDLMSQKLDHSQEILTGLVRGEFETIAASANQLNALSQQPQWDRFQDDPVYSHFTVEFQRISQRLAGHARAENLEAAAYTAQLLTANCIACHQHVRDVKAIPAVSP